MFLYLFLSFFFAAVASTAAVPSPVPTCYSQFLHALSDSPKKATSFCSAFTKTTDHETYPDFIFDYCDVETWVDTKLDRILSTVCSTYIHATSTPKSTSATSTKKTSSSSVKATTTTKKSSSTSSKTSAKTSSTLVKSSSSSKKTSSSTAKSSSVKASSTKITSSVKTSSVKTSSVKTSSVKTSSVKTSSIKTSSVKTSSTKTSSVKTSSISVKSSSSPVKSSSISGKSSVKSSSSSAKSSTLSMKTSSSSVKATSSSVKATSTSSVKATSRSSSSTISGKISSVTSKLSSSIPVPTKISSSKSASSVSSSSATTSSLAAAPTATLVPVTHYDTDTTDLNNLVPQNSSALYYAEESYLSNPYLSHMYLHMNVNFTYPTVVTEHSSWLQDFNCMNVDDNTPLAYQISYSIYNKEAWQIVHDTWGSVKNLVLITNSDTCSQTSNNTRSYWLGYADQIYWNENSGSGYVNFHGDEILTVAGITDGSLVWGTVASTNTTSSASTTATTYTNSALCSQTSDPKHPTLAHINPCTANFDQALDEQIGLYYEYSNDRLAELSGLELQAANYPSLVHLQNQVAAAQSADSQGDDSWFSTVLGDLEDFVESAAESVVNYIESWIPSIPDGDLKINMSPSPLVDSPWGDAFLIYKHSSDGDDDEKSKRSSDLEVRTESSTGSTSGELAIYCVDCGVKGDIQFSGSASFSLTDGVSALSVGMDGNLEIGINLGLDASITYTFPAWSKDLATPQGIPILEVEGIIIIGPIIELKAELELELGAEGKVLTGASLSLPSFSANLDLVNTEYTTASGFDNIVFNKYFKAEGEITASATLSLPFSVGVGINLIPLGWDKQVKIVEKPGFKAEIAYTAEVSSGNVPTLGSADADDDDDSCDGGISWDLKLVNEVEFNFFDVYESKIADYESPSIIEGCFTLGSTGNSSADDYSNTGASSTTDSSTNSGVSMIDSTGKFTVYAASDGNMYLQGVSLGQTTYWQPETDQLTNSSPDTLIADDKGRDLYVYWDEMAAYGVSRVRALFPNEVPSQANRMVFGFGDIDDNSGTPDQYFITASEATNYPSPYMPVACTVTDAQGRNATKVFATTYDVQAGMETLTGNVNLASTITGGTVNSCIYLLLQKWQTA